MLLKADKSQLLIVDMQDKLLNVMADPDGTRGACARMIEAAQTMAVPITLSEQYPKGLGPTNPELRAMVNDAEVMEKVHFSAARDQHLGGHIEEASEERHQLVIGGIEAHICVQQTALDFADRGLNVFVVSDGVSSRDQRNVNIAFDRLRAHGVEIVNSETVMFEWLEKAGTDEFKKLSKLIR